MAREIYRQGNFTGGELDPACVGRRDLKAYTSSLALSVNLMPKPQGPLHRRPGLAHVSMVRNALAAVPTGGATVAVPNGGTAAHLTDGTGFLSVTPIGTTAPYVVAEFDFGAPVEVGLIDLEDFAFTEAGGAVPAPPQYPWTGGAGEVLP